MDFSTHFKHSNKIKHMKGEYFISKHKVPLKFKPIQSTNSGSKQLKNEITSVVSDETC